MKVRSMNIFSFLKLFLQIGILILFVGGFIKLFNAVPNKSLTKFIFLITYLWFTIGINVNFIMPLISLLDSKINQRKK